MKYAVNVNNGRSKWWEDAEKAIWFGTWKKAFRAAEAAFDDSQVQEVMLAKYDDEWVCEPWPLYMVREGDYIYQYQAGERLWA